MATELSSEEIFLIEQVKLAFAEKFQRPTKVTVYSENDPNDYDGEGQSVEDFYKGLTWSEINLEHLAGYQITYLNSDALLHYLPAFLIKVIQDKVPKTDFTDRLYSLFSDLDYWGYESNSLLAALSGQQKSLINIVFALVSNRSQHYYDEYQIISQKFG